jgi:hypothetical protein
VVEEKKDPDLMAAATLIEQREVMGKKQVQFEGITYPVVVLEQGIRLYNGMKSVDRRCPLRHSYVGQSGRSSGKRGIVYFSTSITAAQGYAQCRLGGWVRLYRVSRPPKLLDATQDMVHMDGDEVAKICRDAGLDGFITMWSPTDHEVALCCPDKFLKYLGAIRCEQNQMSSVVECEDRAVLPLRFALRVRHQIEKPKRRPFAPFSSASQP